jgi:peptidoglycan/LPS O-acetylase OafA/YrhL
MRYYPHIDGLRTLAVVPVVLFHLNHAFMPGGYVGVDVFFVISGYLITTILYRDLIAGKYSLLEFYKRRILRIIPALLVVFLLGWICSALFLLPPERSETGKTMIAAALFVSNIWFWKESGYFEAPAEVQPFLHTWSLAVEEQFYIFFPPLMFLLFLLFRRHLLATVLALSLASLVACIAIAPVSQPSAFYLLPFRAWELGIGAMLAIVSSDGKLPAPRAVLPAILGAAMLVGANVLLTKDSLFPTWNALFPCLGAALLIGWGGNGLPGKILSSRPLVFIGGISYSFYLFHWPVIVFWRLTTGNDITVIEAMGLFVVSGVLAYLSTRYVEQPFRSRRARSISAPRVVTAGAVAIALLIVMGVSGLYNLPALRSYPAQILQIAEVTNYRDTENYRKQYRLDTCFTNHAGTFADYDPQTCAQVRPGVKNVLVIGDSHAAQYWRAIATVFPEANVMQATASGCRQLLGAPGIPTCLDMRDWIFDTFLVENQIDAVILGGQWEMPEMQYVQPTIARLLSLVDKVGVIGPIVEYDGLLPHMIATSEFRNEGFDFDGLRVAGKPEIDAEMRRLSEESGASFIDVLATLCPDGETCKLRSEDGLPIQFDYGHLTLAGATELVTETKDAFAAVMD